MPLPPRIWSLARFPLPTIFDKPMLCVHVHYPLMCPECVYAPEYLCVIRVIIIVIP